MLISQRLNRTQQRPLSNNAPAPEEYVQPDVDDLFEGGSPQWGEKYDKYIASTQVPHPLENSEYYDEAADLKAQKAYYGEIESMPAEQRMKALHDLVETSHEPNPKGYHYVIAKDLYTTVDRRPDGTVRSIYDQ